MTTSTIPTPSDRLKVAVIGGGAIGPRHADGYAASGRTELVGVVDTVPEKAEAFAKEYGTRAFTSVAELLAATDPALVSVATPPGTHLDIARELLAAGVSVVVEKPPVLSLEQLDELARLDSESIGSVSVIFQHRFGSGAVRARELLRTGELGIPYFVLCETSWYRPRKYFDPEWRGTWSGEGGGPTLGHGIHQIDLMLHLMGPWRTVDATTFRLDRPVEFEDVSLATVVFENGAVGTVINSLVSPRELTRIRIDTSQGSLEVNHLYGYSDRDWSFYPAPGWDGPQVLRPGVTDGPDVATNDDLWTRTAGDDVPSNHEAQLAALVGDVLDGRPHEANLETGRPIMEFVTALYASAFTGEPVDRADLRPGHPFYDHLNGGLPQATIDEITTGLRRPRPSGTRR
jgi:predicted dehydrogenase